jgi:glutaredoxin 3
MHRKDCLGLILVLFIFIIISISIFGPTNFGINMASNTSSSAPDHIQELIHKYPVVVFSKSSCPYCRKAKNILSKYKLDDKYSVLELNELSNTDEYQTELKKLTDDRTVPRIFIGGKCIGDEEDLETLEKQGDLKRLLHELKAIEDL